MAEIVAFPPSRRIAYVRRQAEFVLGMNREAGERHITRQVSLQRGILLSKGVDPGAVEAACGELESALRAALWKAVFQPPGAA
jgi:hypothetical protein